MLYMSTIQRISDKFLSIRKKNYTHIEQHKYIQTIKNLETNSHPQGKQIKNALIATQQNLSISDKEWVNKIENERKRLQSNMNPLDDGNLGNGGLFDKKKTIQDACFVSKGRKAGISLYFLTLMTKPTNVIELGTNVGISAAYIGAALQKSKIKGQLVTLDVSPYRQRLAKEVHQNIGLDNISYVQGLFTDTLSSTLENLKTVDLAFIDGHHQYQPTLDYFNQIFEYSTPNAVFVFDDIRWSDGMKKAWVEICADDRLDLIIDLDSVGIGIRSEEKNAKRFHFGPLKLF